MKLTKIVNKNVFCHECFTLTTAYALNIEDHDDLVYLCLDCLRKLYTLLDVNAEVKQ